MKPTLKLQKESNNDETYLFPQDGQPLANALIGKSFNKPDTPEKTLKEWMGDENNIRATLIN